MERRALVTAAVCTYNRYDYLRKLLPVLERQSLPRDQYTALIVDNSDDAQKREAFAAEFAGRPGVEVTQSSPPGLSRARNAAIDACRTPYIAFLDDDAIPTEGWLAAVVAAFKRTDAAWVAGPIDPIWPTSIPAWLPQRFISCLTVLDLGRKDHWLGDSEFAYGANMSFQTEILKQAGGFNVGLGRIASTTLLSEEEIELQFGLKSRGQRGFYAAGAKVSHMVHTNRLSRNYFRARMAWQAVSSLLRTPPQVHGQSSLQGIKQASEKLGISDLLYRLVEEGDSETFSTQIELIYNLIAIFLESKDIDDWAIEGYFAGLVGARAPARSPAIPDGKAETVPSTLPNGATPINTAYEASASISPEAEHLFIEGRPSHFFMRKLYAELPRSQLVTFPHDMWANFDEPLEYLARSMTPRLRSITFITVDPLIYGPSRRSFLEFLRKMRVPCFGILHRPPELQYPDQAVALREVAPYIRRLIGLAKPLVDIIHGEAGLENLSYVPLHSPYVAYLNRDPQKARDAIGAAPEHVVFSVLGELREGKGAELLFESLGHLPEEVRHGAFFLFAGRSNSWDAAGISDLLKRQQIKGRVDLQSSTDPLRYYVISDRLFAGYLNASDVGLLLYQDAQRRCMSGVLPNYVWNRKPVVSTRDSVVGQLVLDHELGFLVDEETPLGVAKAITAAFSLYRNGWRPSTAFETYRAACAPDAVLQRLSEILDESAYIAPATGPR